MFIIQVPFCDVAQIFKTEQSFRWRKLGEYGYFVTHKDKGVRVQQQKDRLIFDCDEKSFFDVWYNYFDICTDYQAINLAIRKEERELKPWSVRAAGVHVLKQDLFEVIISSMLLRAKSKWGVPDYSSILEFLCDTCGCTKRTSIRGAGVVKWHIFPTPEQIIRKRKALLDDGLGGCAANIVEICQDIADGWLDMDELKSKSYDEAKEFLQSFAGINRWIAERICAFGLCHGAAYPIDKTSIKALREDFDCSADDFADWYLRGKAINKNRAVIALWAKYRTINPPKGMV